MKSFIVLSMLFAAAVAQLAKEQYIPIPYSFNYISETEDGGKGGHQEEGDGAGRVTGSYTLTNLEGHTRVVDYVADENGFRATIRTNEPGTDNQSPADVVVESSAADAGPVRTSAPVARPVAPPTAGRTGTRYVLVPINQ